MKDYETLLDQAYRELPEKTLKQDRFKMPFFVYLLQGSQTVVKNFSDVCAQLRRDPKHLAKFLSRELATSINIDGSKAVFQGRFREDQVNKKLAEYVAEFVLCRECGKPDTKITEVGKIKQLLCEACGARRPVKQL